MPRPCPAPVTRASKSLYFARAQGHFESSGSRVRPVSPPKSRRNARELFEKGAPPRGIMEGSRPAKRAGLLPNRTPPDAVSPSGLLISEGMEGWRYRFGANLQVRRPSGRPDPGHWRSANDSSLSTGSTFVSQYRSIDFSNAGPQKPETGAFPMSSRRGGRAQALPGSRPGPQPGRRSTLPQPFYPSAWFLHPCQFCL